MLWHRTRSKEEDAVAKRLRASSKFFKFLWSVRDELFADGFEEELIAARVHLDAILEKWKLRAESGHLKYADYRQVGSALMKEAGVSGGDAEAFPTMWSLRDVDKESNLYFVPEKVDA